MEAETQPTAQARVNPMWMSILGWIITLLPAGALIASGVAKIMKAPPVVEGFPALGWYESSALGLGIVELGCAVVYLFPPTAVLGAILLTGYLGGAVATHVRLGEDVSHIAPPIIMGVLVWLGVYLRDERMRALAPLRRSPSPGAPGGGFISGLGKVLVTLVVIIAVVAGLVFALPSEHSVTRKTTIAASPSEVFVHVNDFHKWGAWSPWKKLDPAAKETFEGPPAGIGAIFKWSGNDDVGEGMMTLLDSHPDDRIKIKLDFMRPVVATADVEFSFKAQEGKTVVTWTMTGVNDFQYKAIHALFLDMMLGAQFDEGLANLKRVVEKK